MASSPRRFPTQRLAAMLGRLSIALSAGVDLRRAWTSETERTPSRWRPPMDQIQAALSAGEPLATAMQDVGVFPPLVVGMIAVGEQTGHEPETLRSVAAVLERQVRTTRALRGKLAWPAFQLSVAIAVVGFLIFIAGVLRDAEGEPIDLLGVGLTGVGGLLIYLLLLAAAATAAWFGLTRLLKSWQNHGVVRRLLTRVPVLGPAALAAEAALWCRAASLAAGAGLDAGRLVDLASSVAPGLTVNRDHLVDSLREGSTLAEALADTGCFPPILCEGLAVGEAAGKTDTVLARLADDFDDEAARGFTLAAQAAGGGVWVLVAGIIIFVIFRLFSGYLAILSEAGRGI
jgi:type II secretory pathway component PulF